MVDFTLDNIGVDLTEDDCGYPEGRGSLRQHIARERNSTLSKKAKEKYKREHGRIFARFADLILNRYTVSLEKTILKRITSSLYLQ